MANQNTAFSAGAGRAVGVATDEPLLLEDLQLVGHARGTGQPDGLADLAHARRVAAPLHAVTQVLESGKRTADLWRGDKTGKDRWYEEHVPLADKLHDTHLDELRKEGLNDGKKIL